MPNTFQFRRGIVANLPSLSAGEPALTTDQFRIYAGSAGGNRLLSVLHKINGTTAPGVNDDSAAGYSPGSRWIDTTNSKTYVCVSAGVGAAVWQQTSGTGAGGITELTGDVTAGPGSGSQAATIASDAVTNAKLANMATARFKGRVTSGTGDPEDLTGTQATTLLDTFTSSLKGLVPASGGGTANFLRADGTFAAPPSALDITGLTASDFGWRDEVPVYSQESAANRKLDVERVAAAAHSAPPGRLTLDSALPVSTADVTSSSTLYYLSLNGDRIRLWDGTRYVVRRIGAGLVTTQTWTSSKNYDIWAYASAYTPSATNTSTDVVTVATSPPTGSSVLCTTSAGGLTVGTVYYWNQASGTTGSFHTTLANALAGTSKVDLTANVTGVLLFACLETLVWTNDSTRATALAIADGLYYKSGDQTRLYLGTVRVGSLGTIFDTVAARGVWNNYNRRKRAMRAVKTSGSWTYATNTWRSANADSTLRCELVLGIAEDAVIGDVAINYTGSSSAGAVGIGLDQTAGNDAQIVCEAGPAGATDDQTTRARYAGTPAAGYHYLQWIEKVRAGTGTFRADLTPSVGLEVEVWA